MTFFPVYDPVIYQLAKIDPDEIYTPTPEDWADYAEYLAEKEPHWGSFPY